MLFSATQTRRVEDLARISLKKEPLYVGVDDDKEKATVDGLEQVFCWVLSLICQRDPLEGGLIVCAGFRATWFVHQRSGSSCSSPFLRRTARRS